MLTFLGFAMVITFMFLIMTKRLSALIALIIVPILFALFGGFAPKIGPMMLEGITKLAPDRRDADVCHPLLCPDDRLRPV
jgi:citrate-Mg2+:H+ or citrate-Ca2+:H+ symporter, CitMHS family